MALLRAFVIVQMQMPSRLTWPKKKTAGRPSSRFADQVPHRRGACGEGDYL